MKFHYYSCIATVLFTVHVLGQNETQDKPSSYLSMKWKDVATKMPVDWYGANEAQEVTENILLTQKDIGGWEKNKPYHHIFTVSEKADYIERKSEIGGTFDNGATITELRFLAKVYAYHRDERYKKAIEKGINYILVSQYENGGWPQFFPVRAKEHYSAHITFNDNAMVNTMEFLNDIVTKNEFDSLQLSNNTKTQISKAYEKGIACILKTQIMVEGKPTVWCAQHDEKTLTPAKARTYELESFSGGESVRIVKFLMGIPNPSDEIIKSVEGALHWFEENKIEGIKIGSEINSDGEKNRIVVEDKNAPPLWGRFYDLETSEPFFCSRDGIKRKSLAEISHERRNGYSWYTNAPEGLFEKYDEWKLKLKNQ